MLDSFPELFRPVEFWDREPLVGGGYRETERVTYRVIILPEGQEGYQEKALGKRAETYKALDIANHDVMYSKPWALIKLGMFLSHPDDGEIYMVDQPLEYAYVGGYNAWGINKVQGANGTNQCEISLKEGVY
jgi:hypothetical protein